MKAIQTDITILSVDVIVNAANTSLLGGGGVDAAIHKAAGPELLAECRTVGGCPTGEARLTAAYHLPADWVVHTVGPVWHGGDRNEAELLASCYYNSLTLAMAREAESVALPAISSGAFGYPIERAARIAVKTCSEFQQAHNGPKEIIFACFDERSRVTYQSLLERFF